MSFKDLFTDVPAKYAETESTQTYLQNKDFQGKTDINISPKKRIVAFILCWCLGVFGVHRFYVDKIGTGVLYLFTFGLLGIGVFVDIILILVGSFKDATGAVLKDWT